MSAIELQYSFCLHTNVATYYTRMDHCYIGTKNKKKGTASIKLHKGVYV